MGTTEKFKQNWTDKNWNSKMEHCLILPSANWYGCMGRGTSGIWYLRNKGAFPSLWILGRGVGVRRKNSTVRKKLLDFSLLHSPTRYDPAAGRVPNQRQMGLMVYALLSPLFNKVWGSSWRAQEPQTLLCAFLPTQPALANKFLGLTLPELAGLCPQFHWDGPLKTHYKLFRLWLWLLLGSEQN